MVKKTPEEIRKATLQRAVELITTDGAWQDVTNKHDTTAKKDLKAVIEHEIEKALEDYHVLLERYK